MSLVYGDDSALDARLEKALGDAGELSWWDARIADAAARQRIPIPR